MTAALLNNTHAITLRDYQIEDRQKVVDGFLHRGLNRLLGVWPTGGGKTVMFSELHLHNEMENWLKGYDENRQKILVLAHRDELISQAADKLARSNPDLFIDIDKADKYVSPFADVVVASVQTLTASRGKRLHRLDPDNFRIVVVDEAHHAASPSYQVILQHFGFLPPASFMQEFRPDKKLGRDKMLAWQRDRLDEWDIVHKPDRLLLGVTATPKRGDNIGLECVFQDIAFSRTIREMIERGYLCKVRAFRVLSNTSIDQVATRAGDFASNELSDVINKDDRNAKSVRAYLDYASGRKGITFCATVAHSKSMAEAYNAAGVPSVAVFGSMPEKERKQVLADFKAGRILMLTNCNVLTEGFDEPDVQCIVHARPTKSSLLYIQMTGRGLRIADGKEDCIIIDIVDLTKKHSLITSPELFGLPANFDAKGSDLLDAKRYIEEVQAQNPLADMTDIKSIEDCKIRVAEVDVLGRFHDEHIDQHAKLAWRKTGEGYELSWRGQILQESLSITKDGDKWVTAHKKGREAAWQRFSSTPEAALKLGEQYLKNNFEHIHHMNRKDVEWVNVPATPTQREMIAKMHPHMNVDALTKGQARDIMNAYYFDKWKDTNG